MTELCRWMGLSIKTSEDRKCQSKTDFRYYNVTVFDDNEWAKITELRGKSI